LKYTGDALTFINIAKHIEFIDIQDVLRFFDLKLFFAS